jgi:drug/metabolite transporter (DMT)-like permease
LIKPNSLLPIFAAISSNILWGSTFMASKVVLTQCPPITAITIRFVIALITFLIVAVVKGHDFQWPIVKTRFRELFLLGVVGYTGLYLLQMVALTEITSVQSSAIMLLAPLFTLILTLVETRNLNVRNSLVLFLSFIGAVLIFFDHYKIEYSVGGSRGLIYTLIASFFLGWSVPITKKILNQQPKQMELSTFNLTFFSIAIGTFFLSLFSVWELTNSIHPINLDSKFWMWITYLGVLCSSLAFFLWNWSIKKVSPIVVAASMYLKTPVALFIGALFLSENLSFMFYLGTSIIISTLFINQIIPPIGGKR